MVFIGIDVGTQGVRAIAADETGKVLAGAHREYKNFNRAKLEGYKEQAPEDWWDALLEVIDEMDIEKPDAICIDGTSGTIIALDENDQPIGNAIMYNDVRGQGGKALPKIRWMRENGINAHRYVHQADYIVGKLTGRYDVTDWSNALKSGYDVRNEEWTQDAKDAFGENIPKVVAVGTPLFSAGDMAPKKLQGALVIAGASDGYMSAVATCAVNPGEWASIIGTTLILKGVTNNFIEDPTGCVYCHKHPQGMWMPGGASNVGGRCLNEWFIPEGEDSGKVFDKLNAQVECSTPTGKLVYPLMTKGERFPFLDKEFAGFGDHDDYTAVLEGISYVEKMCFEKLQELGCEVGDTIYSTGGACRSDEWLQLRANILQKTIKVPAVTDAAIGGAMLAAAAMKYGSLGEAAAAMGRFDKVVTPVSGSYERYKEHYQNFKTKVAQR